MRFSSFLAVALAIVVAGGSAAAPARYGYTVVASYPHDTHAFTEGLFYREGWLYESTGLEGASTVRKVNLRSGVVALEKSIPAAYFGEGVVDWKGKLVELTWRSQIGFIYDLADFRLEGLFRYPGEGWALTRDDRRLIMSDGTSSLRFLDPETLRETGRLQVTDEGRPVVNLNELEYVRGEIYANIWQTDRIARIDPKSGVVVGWIDLGGLARRAGADASPDAVLNGIAYDAARDRLFVTGKLWPKVFEIKLIPLDRPQGRPLGRPRVRGRLRAPAASGKTSRGGA